MPPVYSKTGEPCSGLYGVVTLLRKFLVGHPHDAVYLTVDAGVPRFRKRLVPQYKQKREEDRKKDAEKQRFYDELTLQMRVLPEVLATLGVHAAYCKGFEADDVIGALALRRFASCDCTILSEDKDLMQLVDGRVIQYRLSKKTLVTNVPTGFLIQRCLVGDSSDGIPGVYSIGEKRAATIIQATETDDLRTFFESLDPEDKYEALVLEHRKDVKKFYRAMSLRHTAKHVNRRLEITHGAYDLSAFKTMCKSYGWKTFLQQNSYYCKPFERASANIDEGNDDNE